MNLGLKKFISTYWLVSIEGLIIYNRIDLSHRYSDTLQNTKVLVLGPYPPPLGGISVHVKRLVQKLKQQKNTVFFLRAPVEYRFSVFLLPYRFLLFSLIKLFVYLLFYRPKVVIYHPSYLSNSTAELELLCRLKKIFRYQFFLIEHNCRHMYKRSAFFKKRFDRVVQRIDKLVLIGNVTYKSYVDNQINIPENVSIEGAFLPPDSTEEKAIMQTYPESLLLFIKQHTPVLIVNAFQLVLLEGKDLYGIDLCIELINQRKKTYPQIGLVIMLSEIGNQQYFDQLQNNIKQLNLAQHVYILHTQKELWPLLKKCDVFVRPTLSDSFGISIAEALHVGTPAVASDVCKRPEGTELFATRDVHDFIQKVDNVLRREYAAHNQQRDNLYAQQTR